MSLNLPLDFNQLKVLIDQCTMHEKLEIIRVLEKETFPMRFRQILKRMKNQDLSMEDITNEVESIRAARYNNKQND